MSSGGAENRHICNGVQNQNEINSHDNYPAPLYEEQNAWPDNHQTSSSGYDSQSLSM